jgi:hypothetical protein
MPETYFPPLQPQRWAEVLSHEVRRHPLRAPAAPFSLDDLDTLLAAAEERTRPRTVLPAALDRFPFNWGPVRRALLTFLKRLFHDQRAVNTVLIQALRETLAVNRYLLRALAERDRAEGGQA